MRWRAYLALAGLLACGAALAQERPVPVVPPPAPAGEPEAVRALRALLGPGTRLTYAAAEVIEPVRGTLRLREVALIQPEGRVTAAELLLDGLRAEAVEEAAARGVVLHGPRGEMRMDALRLAGVSLRHPAGGEAPRPDMVRADALRIEGLTVPGEAPVAIATLVVEEYGAGRPGRARLEGLEIRPAEGGGVDRISLERLELRGLDLAATLTALAGQEVPPPPPGPYSLEAEGLSLRQGGRPVGALGTLRLGGEITADGTESGRLALRDIRVEPFPGLDAWLRRFGYAALLADLTAETRYERGTGRLEIGALSLAAREVGALSLSLDLEGATAEALEAQDLDAMRLRALALRYTDHSLYGRFVREQARQTRQAEPQVRRQLAAQAAAALAAEGEGAALAPVREAILRFLRSEAREVEFVLRPPQPLPLSELPAAAAAGPAELQRLLGLGATAR
jgi:hypothetical protein